MVVVLAAQAVFTRTRQPDDEPFADDLEYLRFIVAWSDVSMTILACVLIGCL